MIEKEIEKGVKCASDRRVVTVLLTVKGPELDLRVFVEKNMSTPRGPCIFNSSLDRP